MASTSKAKKQALIQRQDLQALFHALKKRNYDLIGPTLRDGAIVYEHVETVEDLPIGWTDEQEAGTYTLKRCNDQAVFGYTLSPQSWKRFLHPPIMNLWQAQRNAKQSFDVIQNDQPPPRYAFIGVRACELEAIFVQDRVFAQGEYVDPVYKQRRDNAFIVAVNCTQAGKTCFCASMQTGPRAAQGFDLALTELIDTQRHVFFVEVGSPKGEEVLSAVRHTHASQADADRAAQAVEAVTSQMGRRMQTEGIKELLQENTEHPQWDEIASRCLNCANCTMVCPTCFCTTVEDVTDLKGERATRVRKWDSCFTMDFSYIHGGSVRSSTKARYRQWLTHKLAGWIDQFGASGCVGCGRCITWCPVGIDITQAVDAIRNQMPTQNAGEDAP